MSSRRRGDRPKVVAVSVIALPCAFFVVIEPDFGTASIIVAIGLAGLYAVGVSSTTMLKSFATLIAAATAYALANPYAVRRFTGLLHQGQDLLSTNYQLHQSKIAVGSGGLTGKGLGGSTLKFGALPNPHTDFIFSILGEEFGLIGACVVVMLFALFIWFGINVAMRAKDAQGTLIALSVTTWIGLQAIINISSTIGLFPVTGVPLPFISYGGTALIVDLVAIGLLINVAKGERPPRRTATHRPKATPRAQVAGQRNRPRRSPAMSGAARPAQGISRRSR
jgi:cell division protein FtsW